METVIARKGGNILVTKELQKLVALDLCITLEVAMLDQPCPDLTVLPAAIQSIGRIGIIVLYKLNGLVLADLRVRLDNIVLDEPCLEVGL